jgi:large-conductance mechanosensitive channel
MKSLKILVLFIFILLLSKCNDEPTNIIVDTRNPHEIINIKVDPRMELLSIIQHYTSWAEKHHTKLEFAYKNEIDNYFKNYGQHPAVQKSEILTNSGFSYDAPATFVLYHSDLPEFKQIVPYSSYLIGRAGGESNLIDFANKIREFSDTTNFMEFFNSHKNYYFEIENDINETIGVYNYIKLLEDYYGESKRSYNIIPTQLFQSGGYGPEITTSEGKDIYNICGTQTVIFGKPNFGNQDNLLGIILHEFSHSFVNPITEKNTNEINKYSKLMDPIKDKMQQMAYGNWLTCVNEHLVRANTIRFFVKLRENIIKENYLESEYQKGFIYIKKLDTLLDEYEKYRDVYTTYESFYPKIIELFKSLM